MSNLNTAKKIIYVGEHSRLISGEKYTVKELSSITGLTDNILRYRIGDANTITDYEFRASRKGYSNKPPIKHHTLTTSQTWLRRSLI